MLKVENLRQVFLLTLNITKRQNNSLIYLVRIFISRKRSAWCTKITLDRAHDSSCLAKPHVQEIIPDGDNGTMSRKFLYIRHGTGSEKIRSKQGQQCDSNQTCRHKTLGFFRLSKRNLPYLYAWLTIVETRLYVSHRKAYCVNCVAPDPRWRSKRSMTNRNIVVYTYNKYACYKL